MIERRSTDIRGALRARQRGFLLNPFRFGGGGATDPFFSDVVTLLPFIGPDGSTTITDESPSPKTWTAYGNAQIDTAESIIGSSSCLFDGTGDYVSTPSDAAYNLGTGNFTVDGYFRTTAAGVLQYIGGQCNSTGAASTVSFRVNITSANQLQGRCTSGGSTIGVIAGGAVSTNTWHHFAYVRNGTGFTLYLDGVSVGTASSVSAVNSSVNALSVGRWGEFNSNLFTGHIGPFRLTKAARWTSAFTPPTVYPTA